LTAAPQRHSLRVFLVFGSGRVRLFQTWIFLLAILTLVRRKFTQIVSSYARRETTAHRCRTCFKNLAPKNVPTNFSHDVSGTNSYQVSFTQHSKTDTAAGYRYVKKPCNLRQTGTNFEKLVTKYWFLPFSSSHIFNIRHCAPQGRDFPMWPTGRILAG
jgi:hypothetical protein